MITPKNQTQKPKDEGAEWIDPVLPSIWESKEELNKEKRPGEPPAYARSVRFTGIARSIECFMKNGSFNNFRIVTLTIEDGIVTHETVSDPYAQFEAEAKMIVMNTFSLDVLNGRFEPGKAWDK